MVTAGHCGNIGTKFYSPGGQYFGEIRHKASYPTYDLAMISLSSYAGRGYVGVSNTVHYGVSSDVGEPGYAGNYCSSGATSLEKCGLSVTSVTAEFCDLDGDCTYPLISYIGGAPQPGDSGAPFYAKDAASGKMKIRGVVIAREYGVGYAEKWSRVAQTFIASIVTG